MQTTIPNALPGRQLIIKVFFALITGSACFAANPLTAKELPKYVVSLIPDDLKQNVNAVYWEDKMVFEILSRSTATFKLTQVITILNPNAKDLAEVAVPYDKLCRVKSIRGVIYDAYGNVARKIKPNEIIDHSMFDGFSLFSDNRVKEMDLSTPNYPYTVEYEYELEYKFLFFIPDYAAGGENFSVMNSEFTLIYPHPLKPRYVASNINVDPIVTKLGDDKESTSWKFKNLKPITLEPLSVSRNDVIPMIECAPSEFEFEGYKGSMESWDSFGLWINSLHKGRNVLPEQTRRKAAAIAGDFSDPKEKVMALYKFMQERTRYVSIQLGIGGFQPFDATTVDVNGYGDCKALSNYMVSLLSTVGIKAHYTLVFAGRTSYKMNTRFPSSQFNHAVVCVPMKKDTIWLECTSQTNPFGYMGSFTGNRKALAITDDGAKIVNTPAYTEVENQQLRNATVSLDDKGNATAKVETRYSGIQYENGDLFRVVGGNSDGQKKWVLNNTAIPVFDVVSFSVTDKNGPIPEATVSLNLTLNKLATLSGKRLFLTPNLMNRSSFIPPKLESRKTPVILRNGFTDIDTITYTVSDLIYPEFLPQPVKVKSRFGEYESSFNLEQGKVVYVRKFIMRRGEYPADSYSELTEFYKAVNRADNTKIVFLNKT
jgi:hypothetical protein